MGFYDSIGSKEILVGYCKEWKGWNGVNKGSQQMKDVNWL